MNWTIVLTTKRGQAYANVNLQFRFTDWLNANAIVAYTASHTTIEGWWGEKSYHAACLRKTENGVRQRKEMEPGVPFRMEVN